MRSRAHVLAQPVGGEHGSGGGVLTMGGLARHVGGKRAGWVVDGFLVFTQISFCIACAPPPSPSPPPLFFRPS
jgi:hypothetical protein